MTEAGKMPTSPDIPSNNSHPEGPRGPRGGSLGPQVSRGVPPYEELAGNGLVPTYEINGESVYRKKGEVLKVLDPLADDPPLVVDQDLRRTVNLSPNYMQDNLHAAQEVLERHGMGIRVIRHGDVARQGFKVEPLPESPEPYVVVGEFVIHAGGVFQLPKDSASVLRGVNLGVQAARYPLVGVHQEDMARLLSPSSKPNYDALPDALDELYDAFEDHTGDVEVFEGRSDPTFGPYFVPLDNDFSFINGFAPLEDEQLRGMEAFMQGASKWEIIKAYGMYGESTAGVKARAYEGIRDGIYRVLYRGRSGIATAGEAEMFGVVESRVEEEANHLANRGPKVPSWLRPEGVIVSNLTETFGYQPKPSTIQRFSTSVDPNAEQVGELLRAASRLRYGPDADDFQSGGAAKVVWHAPKFEAVTDVFLTAGRLLREQTSKASIDKR